MEQYYILIPAYKPQPLMLPFLEELKKETSLILVVDDGGGDVFADIFKQVEQMGIPVIHHAVNMGKGRALKTGINEILLRCPEVNGIITADCDGQHTVRDIMRVQETLKENPDKLVIGGRALKENVPFRSRLGNSFMRVSFALATGIKIHDTQTGLRGLPKNLLKQLSTLNGERYEYEMNMLLKLRDWDVKPTEIEIETIYIDNNSGSHYNVLKDSLRIGAKIFLYVLSSMLSYLFEYLTFALLISLGLRDLSSNIIARSASSLLNYALNRKMVFRNAKGKYTLVKYFLLVLFVMLASSYVIDALSHIMSSYIAKPLVDIVFFFFNFIMQRDFVFKEINIGKKS